MNKRLILSILAGSMGGLVFGVDLGALSAVTPTLQNRFGLSPWAFGFTISISIWGTVLGSILAGRFADRYDRRGLITVCSFVYAAAAIGLTLPAPAPWLLLLAMRFLCGTAIGGFTVACPLYLSEIAPISMRGRVVGLFQVQVGIGVIAAFFAGAVCARFAPPATAWKWILSMGALPASALLCCIRLMAASVIVGDRNSATTQFADQSLFVRSNTRLILVATSIAIFNQLSGVNVLLLYMLQILKSGGVDFALGHRFAVLISSLGLATTMLGTVFVDRLGRKSLLYAGSAGMAACLLSLGITVSRRASPVLYLSILIAYNAFFAFSQGTVVWVYLSELFPAGLRGRGQGYGSTIHWIANGILISVFPRVQHASSVIVFYVFAFMMVLQIIVIRLWYPETRGTTLGSIAAAGTK